MPFLTISLQCHSLFYRDIQLLPVDPDTWEIPSGRLGHPIFYTGHWELLCYQDPHGNHPYMGQGDSSVPQIGHTAQRKGKTLLPLPTLPHALLNFSLQPETLPSPSSDFRPQL